MCDAGTVGLVPPWETATLRGTPLIAELFGVPKKGLETLLAILDRGPHNAAEVGLEVVLHRWLADGRLGVEEYCLLQLLATSPRPSLFADLAISSREVWCSSSDGICGFYHALRWPEARCSDNAVGQSLHPEELLPRVCRGRQHLLALAERREGVARQPILLSAGVGGIESSRIAQAYGQWLLRAAGGPSVWMCYGCPAPSGELWMGSYLDDVLAVLSTSSLAPPPLACRGP
jgi:hypothetical protein